MDDLEGKVAVVTGAASGIGRALADRWATEGMKVVLADVLPSRLDEAVELLRGEGLDVNGVVTDVTKAESVQALADRTVDLCGGVHVVCNNAGVGSGAEGYVWEHELNDWRWAMDVNVWGVIHGIRTFVPIMLEQGDEGHVINTSSSRSGSTSASTTFMPACPNRWPIANPMPLAPPVTTATFPSTVRMGGSLHTATAHVTLFQSDYRTEIRLCDEFVCESESED